MTGANDNGLKRAKCLLCDAVGFPSIIAMHGNESLFVCSVVCAAVHGVSVPVCNSELVEQFV